MYKKISLIPFKTILGINYMKRKVFLWIIFFGMTPLLILYVNTYYNLRFERAAWILGGYFCMLWAINFVLLIRPKVSLWSTGVFYALFTAFLGVPLLIGLQQLGIVSTIYASTESKVYIFRVIGFIFGVGLFEETCKLLPVVLFGMRRGKIKSLKDALYLGTMSGLGFALAEAVHYTLMYWQGGAIISLSDLYKNINNGSIHH